MENPINGSMENPINFYYFPSTESRANVVLSELHHDVILVLSILGRSFHPIILKFDIHNVYVS